MTEIRDPRVRTHPAITDLPERLLSARELREFVTSLADDPLVWRPHVRHDPDDRWHARLYWSPVLEVYLLGWDAGQDTRLHDHGGSRGAFCVTEGELTEQYARLGARRLWERRHPTGTAAAFGADYLHNLGNLPEGAFSPATSIHAYSPPLSVMRFYERSRGSGCYVPAYQLPVAGPEPDDRAHPEPIGAAR